MVIEIVIYAAVSSAIYAMLAVGFTLIFGVARVLNLSHGTFYALGAYFTYTYNGLLKLPLFVAALLAVATVAAFGVAIERVMVRPLRHSGLAVLMITLAISLLTEQVLFLTFGSETQNVPSLVSDKVTVFDVDISGQRVLAFGVSVVLISGLWLFIQRARLGNAILAVSQDAEGAQYMGININRVFASVMGLSAALAAAAGVLAAPFSKVEPGMGLLPMTKAFSIVILGGLGSVRGSLLAAVVLGFSETLVGYLISSSLTELVSLVVILLVLILRPAGLFGKHAAF
ncbi:MAG TPA: branched-chain amino acid ABC transporter permease [Kofleriaceae bacterium]|nr:branched-chain amino acid ABC transporter permease [Kofleriaceae bacterium]